jgi:hypothetical protein
MIISRSNTAAAVAVLSTLVAALLVAARPAAAATPQCPEFTPYAQTVFSHPTQIDNPMLPLTPGIRTILDGTVNNDQGQPEAHRVSFTVTDVTKVIQGVRTVVVWDVDLNQSVPGGLAQESELSFWAQDDAGNVWNMGEYPEEFPGGVFAGAPSTWLAGFDEAQPGVHMFPDPKVTTKWSLQGFAPRIDFEDCQRVNKLNQTICIPLNQPNNCTTYDNVLVTEEKDAFDPASGIQTKAYAPGLGIIKIGAIGDPLGETLELVDRQQLGADELAQVRAAVLELDRRAFQFGGPYINTAPAEGPPTQTVETPPVVTPPNTNPPDSRPTVPTNPQPLTLTLDRSKSTVRRALTQRLRKWRITSVKCKRDSRTRVNCTFVATTKRGSRATGTAAVTRRGAEGLVRYVLTAKVVKGGCHPAASSRCTRRSTWRSR